MYNDICILYVYMNEDTIKFLCMYWKLSLIVTWLVCISGYYVPLSIDDRFCLLQSLPKIQSKIFTFVIIKTYASDFVVSLLNKDLYSYSF